MIPPERLLRCGEHTLHFVRLPGRHSGLGRARHFPNISLVGQSHALDNAAGPAVQAQDNVARLEVLGDQRPVIVSAIAVAINPPAMMIATAC